MTLTFDPRSPISIGPVRQATIYRKPRPNRFIRSARILLTKKHWTHTHTHRHTERDTNTQIDLYRKRHTHTVRLKLCVYR